MLQAVIQRNALVTLHALWLFGYIMDGEDVKGNVFEPITRNAKCLFLPSNVWGERDLFSIRLILLVFVIFIYFWFRSGFTLF